MICKGCYLTTKKAQGRGRGQERLVPINEPDIAGCFYRDVLALLLFKIYYIRILCHIPNKWVYGLSWDFWRKRDRPRNIECHPFLGNDESGEGASLSLRNWK